jgi:hypothetical protein
MYAYIVREPFDGFAKGEVLSQAQVDAYAAKGGHADHHAIRTRRPEPPTAAGPAVKAGDAESANPF